MLQGFANGVGDGRLWGQPWQVDGAGAGGKQVLETWCPCAMPVRAHLDHLKKDPGTPGMWARVARVRSGAPGRDFCFGGVCLWRSFSWLAAVIGYFEF